MTTLLMCLPFAGAGAGVYRPWLGADSALLQAVPIQLPGREEEFGKPFFTTMTEAASRTAERIREAAGSQPFVVFGHSFGAILAHETTRVLLETGGPVPTRLLVSGSVSPRHRYAERLDGNDDEAAARAAQIAGREIEAFADPELRALLLPTMRADVNLLADYQPGERPQPLPVPIAALRGEQDHLAPRAEWLDWSAYTSAGFRTVELPGGHMYLTECWSELWKTLEDLL